MADHYLHRIISLIEEAGRTNDGTFDRVAMSFADSLAGGGLVHLFGWDTRFCRARRPFRATAVSSVSIR